MGVSTFEELHTSVSVILNHVLSRTRFLNLCLYVLVQLSFRFHFECDGSPSGRNGPVRSLELITRRFQ